MAKNKKELNPLWIILLIVFIIFLFKNDIFKSDSQSVEAQEGCPQVICAALGENCIPVHSSQKNERGCQKYHCLRVCLGQDMDKWCKKISSNRPNEGFGDGGFGDGGGGFGDGGGGFGEF